MDGRHTLLIVVVATHALSYGLLWSAGSAMQDRYVRPVKMREALTSATVGERAPEDLIKALPALPATAIIFPSCRECTLEAPSEIAYEPFDRDVFALLPGGTDRELAALPSLGPKVRVLSAPAQLADEFGVMATPRVVRVARDGTLTFLQPNYVPAANIWKVVNGN